MKALLFPLFMYIFPIYINAQDTTIIYYEGISPDEISPINIELLGNSGIQNPERGFSIRGGVVDFFSLLDYPEHEYKDDFTGTFNSTITSLEDYYTNFKEDGISLTEIEVYINYNDSLQPISETDILLDINEQNSAAFTINTTLNTLGLKSHLILNSSFSYEQNATNGILNSLDINDNRYTKNLAYLNAAQPFFSQISTRTALVHLGWISTPWDFNHYRLSGHWKRSNYSIWSNYPIGRINRSVELPNYHNTLRESTQRSAWGQVHDQASMWEMQSSINQLKEEVLKATLNIFDHQKVLLKSTSAIGTVIGTSMNVTSPLAVISPINQIDNILKGDAATLSLPTTINYLKDSSKFLRLGYYDHAFGGDTYDHYWTIGNSKTQEIKWTSNQPDNIGMDWANSPYFTDNYNLRKYRNSLWVHGEMPTYETPDPALNNTQNPHAWSVSSFNRHHQYFQNWYVENNNNLCNPQYDYETAENMSSGELQNGFYSALKLRYFNYTSFNITHNNLLDGRSPYEMYDGFTVPEDSYDNQPLVGIGIPQTENTAISGWKNLMISENELVEFGMPVSDKYFQDINGDSIDRSAYEYIRDHLGYRLELQSSEIVKTSTNVHIITNLYNRGFASPQNKRDMYMVLLDANNQVIYQNKLDTDWRTWIPDTYANPNACFDNFDSSDTISSFDNLIIGGIPLGEQASNWHHNPIFNNYQPTLYQVTSSFPISSLPNGNYKVGIVLPDSDLNLHTNPKYSVKFANQALYLPCNGATILGGITIGNGDKDSDGDGILNTNDDHPFNPIDIVAINDTTTSITPCLPITTLTISQSTHTYNEKVYTYPNPATHIIYSNIEYDYAEIIDLNGRTLLTDKNPTDGILVEYLTPGIYICKISKNKISKTSKFIITPQ